MTYQPSLRPHVRSVSHGCLAAAMAAVFIILGGGALAAADYPTKPVRVFVPYGPGGVGDLTMRLLADKLGEQLKQQFVIENRPGAGGIASATQVLRGPADATHLARSAMANRSAPRCSTSFPLTC
jgi:tripartite-type tricarboxylate transporter receptor subunit TctC